jgi:hypothetical protein
LTAAINAKFEKGIVEIDNRRSKYSHNHQCSRAFPIPPSPLKPSSAKPLRTTTKTLFHVTMPDIAQILRDTVSKGNNSTDKAVKAAVATATPVPTPATPQEIPATKPSGIERLFNAIPHPKFGGSPVEKCSGFADYPAEEYHTSLNSVAFISAKNMLESFEHIHDEEWQTYLARVETAMKEMYPLLLPVLDVLYEASRCAREEVTKVLVRSDLGMLYAYEDSLIDHVEAVQFRKWDEKDFIDGEDLNTRFVQRTLRSLRKIVERRRKECEGQQEQALPTIQEDVHMVSAAA